MGVCEGWQCEHGMTQTGRCVAVVWLGGWLQLLLEKWLCACDAEQGIRVRKNKEANARPSSCEDGMHSLALVM
jgi:hypothetical protein